MKTLLRFTLTALTLSTLLSCAKDDPQVRVRNQRTEVTDVALKPPSGSTVNINDVSGGSTTGYIAVGPNRYEVDANVENVSPSATTFFTAEEDETYTIVVLNTNPPTLRVDKP